MKELPKIIFAVSIIALLGAGCAKAPANINVNKGKAPIGYSRADRASGEMTVRILTTGEFDPVTAYVKPGTKVIFKNDSGKARRVASDSDQDAKTLSPFSSQEIAPGRQYAAEVFQNAGRWLYHDPSNPAFGGAIDVGE